jgi:hypothetical protein
MTVWLPAIATGVGSMPGSSAQEAMRIVAGELPDFLHVVELPERGPGADMVGRTAALLATVDAGFGVETTPDGWRISRSVGRQVRRAQSWLSEDLDALEDCARDYNGPIKAAICGPWPLAAQIELPTGERLLRDPSAVRDLVQALAEAARLHVADIRRRVPGATVVLQVDEPALPTVLAGRIGTSSGLSTYKAVDEQHAEKVLREILFDGAGVHCCAEQPPVDLLRRAGAAFVSVDLLSVGQACDDDLGRAFDDGVGVFAGCVASTGEGPVGDTRASAPVRDLLHRLGLTDARWLAQVAVTPACGLAAASPTWTRTALAACRAVGRVVRHDESDEEDQR